MPCYGRDSDRGPVVVRPRLRTTATEILGARSLLSRPLAGRCRAPASLAEAHPMDFAADGPLDLRRPYDVSGLR
jgi:hypothetical protein